jgi:hypothetical protein
MRNDARMAKREWRRSPHGTAFARAGFGTDHVLAG